MGSYVPFDDAKVANKKCSIWPTRQYVTRTSFHTSIRHYARHYFIKIWPFSMFQYTSHNSFQGFSSIS